MNDRPSGDDYRTAMVAGWCWLAVVVIALLASCTANGAEAVSANDFKSFVCRVNNQYGSASNVGSGTLIDKTEDGREGLVLTCAHLFREGTGDISVRFASNKRHRAKLIDIDYQADLAVLTIATPQGEPATANHELDPSSNLYACGFGPLGVYRCATGKIAGQAVSDGQLSLMISDPVRSGDSGGGVFDEQGRLVAVIWGEAQGVTYASYGRPLRTFLSRVLGRKSTVVYACPGGVCPSRPANPPLPRRDTPRGVDARWADFQQQLDELRATKQDRGDYLRRSELPDLGGYVRDEELQRLENEASTRHDSLLQRIENLSGRALGRSVGKAAAGLLGLSGPAGWAIVAGAGVGGWLLGRRVKRKLSGAGGRRRRRFRQ